MCWAHARRCFFELADTSPIAVEALTRIAALDAIETEMRVNCQIGDVRSGRRRADQSSTSHRFPEKKLARSAVE
jgi:hypothetical protein